MGWDAGEDKLRGVIKLIACTIIDTKVIWGLNITNYNSC